MSDTTATPTKGYTCPTCQEMRWPGIAHHCPTGIVDRRPRPSTDREVMEHVSQQYSAYRREMCEHVREQNAEIEDLESTIQSQAAEIERLKQVLVSAPRAATDIQTLATRNLNAIDAVVHDTNLAPKRKLEHICELATGGVRAIDALSAVIEPRSTARGADLKDTISKAISSIESGDASEALGILKEGLEQ